MKKVLFLLTLILTGGLIFLSSCQMNDDDDDDDSNLSVDEHKAKVQNNGVELVTELTALQQSGSVQSLTSFGLYLDDAGGDDSEVPFGRAGSLQKMNRTILAFANGKISSIQFARQTYFLNSGRTTEDEFTSLQELFDENTGTYEWDPVEEDFIFEDNSEDEVIINFPSTQEGTTNNATLTLSNYSGVVIQGNPLDEEYEGDLPTGLDVELVVDGETQMTFGFTVDYSSEGIPEFVETTLTLNDYSLTVDLTNTDTKVGAGVNFLHGEKLLIGVETEANGDFSDSALDEFDETEDPTAVVTDGSFSFTLLNLKFSGDVPVSDIYSEVDGNNFDFYYEELSEAETNADLLETALNNHATLQLTYVDNGEKAADVEWYTFVETEDYGNGNIEYSIKVGGRMVFSDGSKVDAEDFIASGFDELEGAINNLIDEIGEDIGEELEHVDFGEEDEESDI